MKTFIKKTIVLMFASVCLQCLSYAGLVTDRAGIGNVSNPVDIEVQGRVTASSFTMTTNPTLNYVLTSDSQGRGTWQVSVGSTLLNSTNTWTAPNTWNSTGTFLSDLTVVGKLGIGAVFTPSQVLEVRGHSLVAGPNWAPGNDATMYIGDTNHFIKATDGVGVTIQTYLSPNSIVILDNNAGIGLGMASPNEMCTVQGRISLMETTAPGNTAGFGKMYASTSDKQLYYQDDAGASTQLSYDYAVYEDQKTNGTSGGTGTSGGWDVSRIRTLNTTTVSRGSSISRSGNTITLTAGTYRVVGTVPFYGTNFSKARLRNITDNTTAILGTSDYVYHGIVQTGYAVDKSIIDGIVSINATKSFTVQYYISTSNGSEDLGVASSSGDTEVYTRIYIQKIN